MKMKNLFAGLVATSMVAAMGTSAMAEDVDFTLTPNYAEAGTVTVAEAADLATTYAEDQMTVLIFKSDESANPTATDENIVYINQDVASAALFTDMGVKDNTVDDEKIVLEAGTYIVRIGGADIINNGIYQGTFTVSYEAGEPEVTLMYGDANGDNTVNISDATLIMRVLAGTDVFANETNEALADANGDYAVNISDATLIMRALAGTDSITRK